LFQNSLYESERSSENTRVAREVLDALYDLNYNFLTPSNHSIEKVDNVTTFELLLSIHPDQKIFTEVSKFI